MIDVYLALLIGIANTAAGYYLCHKINQGWLIRVSRSNKGHIIRMKGYDESADLFIINESEMVSRLPYEAIDVLYKGMTVEDL